MVRCKRARSARFHLTVPECLPGRRTRGESEECQLVEDLLCKSSTN